MESHYGSNQYFHGMAVAGKTPVEMVQLIANRISKLLNDGIKEVDKGCYFEGGHKIGEALHTLEDIYSQSHVYRGSDGDIVAFQDYAQQDPDKHALADDGKAKVNQGALKMASSAVESTLMRLKSNGSIDDKFLMDNFLQLNKNAMSGVSNENYSKY